MEQSEVQLREVKIGSSNADILGLRELYEEAFPVEEQIPYPVLVKLADTLPLDFTAHYNGDTLVGMTIVLKRDDFSWFWYFAVSRNIRGKGYGSRILGNIKAEYRNVPLILDMEDPYQPDAPNKAQRRLRHDFYVRNGFNDTHTRKRYHGVAYTVMQLGVPTFTQDDYDRLAAYLRRVLPMPSSML